LQSCWWLCLSLAVCAILLPTLTMSFSHKNRISVIA
jgi:hypothetical protein